MSACYTAPYTIPAATLGPENPLPDIKNVSYIHAEIEATKAVPPELTTYTDGMRVIVPADKTFVNYADDNHYYLDFADVPVANGVDISYPKNVKIAQDFFYIPDCAPKWIAAVDEHGVGMMQCSTRNLLGRKLFV